MWFIEWRTIVLYSTLPSIGGVGVLYIAVLSLIVCWNNCSSSRHLWIYIGAPMSSMVLATAHVFCQCRTSNRVPIVAVAHGPSKGVRSTPITLQCSCGNEAVQEAAQLASCFKPWACFEWLHCQRSQVEWCALPTAHPGSSQLGWHGWKHLLIPRSPASWHFQDPRLLEWVPVDQNAVYLRWCPTSAMADCFFCVPMAWCG